jgi:ADP-L-glycero-D-manno-heptose 6-epimerase
MFIITGASGFIGSNLVARLEEKNYRRLVGCDYLGDAIKWQNIAKRNFFDFILPESLFDYLDQHRNQIEVVFHLGAISNTDATDGDLVLKTNYNLPRALMAWCARHRVRFIYASSAATYGKGECGFFDDSSEEYLVKLRPQNLYGWSKHAFDRSVQQIIADKETPHPPQCVGLKFFNVYGPNETHKGNQSSVIPHFLKQIQNNKEARLFQSHNANFADGQQKRDFVYVDDVVDVMLWFCENQDTSGLFNVGTGQARTFESLASSIFKTLDIEAKLDYAPMPERLRDHYQYFTEASMEKLRSAGYQNPFHSLEEGIEKYIKDYLLKEDIYR